LRRPAFYDTDGGSYSRVVTEPMIRGKPFAVAAVPGSLPETSSSYDASEATESMPPLDDNAIRLLRALEGHRALDVLQLAALAELPVSTTANSVEQLLKHKLIKESDGLLALDEGALEALLEARQRQRDPVTA